MKKLLAILVATSFGGLAVVARLGATPPAATAAGTCTGGRSPAVADAGRLVNGTTIAAADGDAVEILGGGRVDRVMPPDDDTGVLRHVSFTAGVGTAYVRDREGDDVVVTETVTGVRRFRAHGEALNPSLSAKGDLVWAEGAGLRLVPAGSTAVRRIPGPALRDTAFAPRFVGDGAIVAGIAAAPIPDVPEDEYLSDLWRYDPGSHRWTQLTRFSGAADRWSVVRTPFVASDGSVEFVRVHGRASLDRTPAYELWQLRGSTATELRSLPGEMYLAGFDGSARLWNLRDGATGSWSIDREEADGTLRQVGCGAVAVDPLDRPDPDRRSSKRSADATRQGTTSTAAPDVDQILVGDFSSADAANQTAARIQSAFGSPATVVDSTQAPTVLRPGVWAVVVPITSDDPEGDLGRFRQALPDLADWSWIVSI
jgi:hypothetical protein